MASPSRLNPDDDPFHPPAIPTEVHCLHCGQEYESYLIEWREEPLADGTPGGRWCCATEGCDGAGFGFDLLPTDPEYVGEDGEKMWEFDGDDEEDDDGDEDDGDELNLDDPVFDEPFAEWQGHEGPLDSQAEKRTGPDEIDADDIPW